MPIIVSVIPEATASWQVVLLLLRLPLVLHIISAEIRRRTEFPEALGKAETEFLLGGRSVERKTA